MTEDKRTMRALWGFVWDACEDIANPANPDDWRPVFADELVRVQLLAAKDKDPYAYLQNLREHPELYRPSEYNMQVLQRLSRQEKRSRRRL